jgi:hypothetical protein
MCGWEVTEFEVHLRKIGTLGIGFSWLRVVTSDELL